MIKMIISLFFICNLMCDNKYQMELEGIWISDDDPNYSLEIRKNTLFEKYVTPNDTVLTEFKYYIDEQSCFGDDWKVNNNDMFLIEIDELEEYYCYKIINLTSNSFTLIYSGNGTFFNFKRMVK